MGKMLRLFSDVCHGEGSGVVTSLTFAAPELDGFVGST